MALLPDEITGLEPFLLTRRSHNSHTLSLRGLATMLNALPAYAISLPAIAEALRSNAFYVRYSAAKKLAERGDREARMLMQELLTTGTTPTRASVARHLYAFSWFAVEPLLRQAIQDSDSRVHEAVVYALCDRRELHAFQLLAEMLESADDGAMNAAAWGLRDCQEPAAVPCLKAALNAADPEIRVKVLESLGANDTPEAIPVIQIGLKDPEADVVYAATLSLIEVAGEAALAQISKLLQQSPPDPEPILRGLFHATNYLKIDILAVPTAQDLIATLTVYLDHPAFKVRKAAFWPLAALPYPHTADALHRACTREQDQTRQAELLAILGGLMPQLYEELSAVSPTC